MKSGVLEDERGAERYTLRKEAIEKCKGVGLFGLGERFGVGDQREETAVSGERRVFA